MPALLGKATGSNWRGPETGGVEYRESVSRKENTIGLVACHWTPRIIVGTWCISQIGRWLFRYSQTTSIDTIAFTVSRTSNANVKKSTARIDNTGTLAKGIT